MGIVRDMHTAPGIYTNGINDGNIIDNRNSRGGTMRISSSSLGGGIDPNIIAWGIATSSFEYNVKVGKCNLYNPNESDDMVSPFGIWLNGNIANNNGRPKNAIEIIPKVEILSGYTLTLKMFQMAGDYKTGLKLKVFMDDITSQEINITYDCPSKRRPSLSEVGDPDEYLFEVDYVFTKSPISRVYVGTNGNANKQFFIEYTVRKI